MRGLRSVLACLLVLGSMPAKAQEGPPAPPDGAIANLVIPPHRADGHYAMPSDGVSVIEAAWHLRAALNVAALGCRGEGEAGIARDYNAAIARHAEVLAKANAAVTTHYRAAAGAAWEDARDRAMTRLYNFFAQVPAHDRFCAAARAELRVLVADDAVDLARTAPARLAALQAPFEAFYARYEAYRTALAEWRARESKVVIATSANVGVTPR